MSLLKKIKSFFSSKSGQAVLDIVLTPTQKAVAALKKTPVGVAILADIKAVSSKDLNGQQKFEAVVANTLPLILEVVQGDGVKAALSDVEDIGRALVQEIYNDEMSQKAVSIAKSILRILGIK